MAATRFSVPEQSDWPMCIDFQSVILTDDFYAEGQDGGVHQEPHATRVARRPARKRVYAYRKGGLAESLLAPESLDGEDVLDGFTLDLREIF